MNPETMSPEDGREGLATSLIFGIACVVERVGAQNIKISCRSREDADHVVMSFWEKRDQDIIQFLRSGRIKPDAEITSGARTYMIERKNQPGGFNTVVLVSENGNPFREETLSVLRDAGMSV